MSGHDRRRVALAALANIAADTHGPVLHDIARGLTPGPHDEAWAAALGDLIGALRQQDRIVAGSADPFEVLDGYLGPDPYAAAVETCRGLVEDALCRLLPAPAEGPPRVGDKVVYSRPVINKDTGEGSAWTRRRTEPALVTSYYDDTQAQVLDPTSATDFYYADAKHLRVVERATYTPVPSTVDSAQ